MTTSPTPLPAIGVRCWRDVVSPSTGAMVLSLEVSGGLEEPMVELGYDEGGGGWWPLSTLVFAAD
ncbi:MAG: hypothetical protein ACK5JJ_13705 [Cyanobacteriota bacterium]|jgi:hypothetical protein